MGSSNTKTWRNEEEHCIVTFHVVDLHGLLLLLLVVLVPIFRTLSSPAAGARLDEDGAVHRHPARLVW